MTGTTTTGSIDGNLRLDIGDFLAKIEIVKRESRALAQEHPTVTVDANTGKAQASMAAVDAAAQAMGQSAATAGDRVKRSATDVAAAQAKVAAANAAADVAYEKARIAQMRLAEAQENGRTKASTLAAAELAVSEAVGRLEKANLRATAAEEALEQAQQEAANAALKLAAAEEVAAKATDQAGNAAGRASARTQLIIAAVVGLTAVAAPLTGALVGIAGGLAGLGAAGVLGVVGVVQAIKQGTQAGQEWSRGLQTLKGDMSALAGTAAAGLLSSFQRSVVLINQNMPQLNTEIAGFSRVLGGAAVTGLQGVITAFHVLNPLFMQGAGLIQDIAAGFSTWASNGGLQKFASYAQSTLPQVVDTLGDLAAAILHIAEATAPIGSAVLGILDGLASGINAIPIPVLTVLASAAFAGYAAFMLWKGVPAVISAVNGALSATASAGGGAAGALGRFGGAAVIATAAISALVMWNQQGVASTTDLSNALKTATSSAELFAKATQGHSIENFIRGDGMEDLKNLPKLMDDASVAWTDLNLSLGQTAALDRIGDIGKAMSVLATTDMSRTVEQFNMLAKGMNDAQAGEFLKRLGPEFHDTLAQAASGMGIAATDANLLAIATGKIGPAVDEARSAMQASRPAADRLAESARGIGTAAEHSVEALNALARVSLGNAEAELRYQETLTQTNATLAENAGNFDITTEAGQRNMGALYDLAGAALAAEDAQKKAGVSSDEIAAKMQVAHDQFVNAAVGAGMGAQEAENLANKLGLIPPNTNADVNVNTATAQGVIDQFINTNNGRTVTIYTSVQGSFEQTAGTLGKSISWAYGGTAGIPGAAYGTTGGTVRGNGSAWSDTAGLYRLANGEEVTSNTVGQAGRWRSLLKAINRNEPAGAVAARASQIAGTQPAAAAPVVVPAPNVQVYVAGKEITDMVTVVVDGRFADRDHDARTSSRKAVL
ncbi:MAG: hypothetical protein JSS52_11300 [Proteobacteria bacterium]|nr:hypothetical protein [Pseudomonadota bacterium]